MHHLIYSHAKQVYTYSFIHSLIKFMWKKYQSLFPCQSTQEKCYKMTQEVNETWLFSCRQWRHCSSASTLHQTIILSDKHIIVTLLCYSMFNSCYSFFLFHITIEISKKVTPTATKKGKMKWTLSLMSHWHDRYLTDNHSSEEICDY